MQSARQPAPLNSPSGDGTSGGMEARLARVEAAVEHIGREIADVKHDVRAIRSEARSDFRLLFGAIIFVALGLAGLMLGLTGLMAKGFHWL